MLEVIVEASDAMRDTYDWPATSVIFVVIRYSCYNHSSQVAI